VVEVSTAERMSHINTLTQRMHNMSTAHMMQWMVHMMLPCVGASCFVLVHTGNQLSPCNAAVHLCLG